MLSYAGVTLLDPTPELLDWLGQVLDPARLPLWADRSWPGHAQEALGFRGDWPRQFQLNTLVWPSGASRFAYGHYLATADDVKRIRAQVYAQSRPVPKDLVIEDGQYRLATPMFLLPPTPLFRVTRPTSGGEPVPPGLFLLTLVDDRYWWWWSAGAVAVAAGTTTWAQLYAALADALEITLTAAAVDAAYLKPPSDLAVSYRALPLLLDAAAASVGQRVVRKIDGTVKTLTARQSLDLHKTNLAREAAPGQPPSPTNPATRLAGHDYDLDATVPGLAAAERDTKGLSPESVVVCFPRESDGSPGPGAPLPWVRGPRAVAAAKAPPPYTVEVTLQSRSIPEYGGDRGFGGEKSLWSTARARFTAGSLSNSSELTSLANRVAEDWYLWRLGRANARYSGVQAWDMEGHAEAVEFSHLGGMLSTLAVRGPFSDHLEDLFHFNSESGAGGTLAQLSDKTFSGDCPVYTAFRVVDTGACTYSDAAVPRDQAVCLPVYSEQGIDLVVAPPPSPRKALPGTVVSDSAAGSVAWDNPGAAGDSDDSWATCTLESGQETQYLKATDFCLSLPSGTTSIDNVTARVEAHADGGGVTDCELKLVVGGSITGTSQHTSTALGTADAVASVTQTPATWTGGALTYSQVNAANFGVAVRFANGAGARRKVFVDAIELRVEFTPHSDGVVASCVVRLRMGRSGTCWLVDHEPRWENVEMDTEADPVTIGPVVYRPGWISRYDQAGKTLLQGATVLILDLSQV